MKNAFRWMPERALSFLLPLIVLFAAQSFATEPVEYSTGSWSPANWGNHRARFSVTEPGEAVWARIPWRRRDAHPEQNHRFDPMEVVATPEEVARLVAGQAENRLLVFPEDRTRPIRMFDALPLRWIELGPAGRFAGEACRNEYYVFQPGLFAPNAPVRNVVVRFSDLKTDSGEAIPSSALCCFNLEGTDWLGRPFTKQVDLAAGSVQPLWIGVDVGESAALGVYEGTIVVGAEGLPDQTITARLTVKDAVLPDRGDADLWRLSRLRWLNSTIGLDDEVFTSTTGTSNVR